MVDSVDLVKDEHDGTTYRVEFLVEEIEEQLSGVASGAEAVFALALTDQTVVWKDTPTTVSPI